VGGLQEHHRAAEVGEGLAADVLDVVDDDGELAEIHRVAQAAASRASRRSLSRRERAGDVESAVLWPAS